MKKTDLVYELLGRLIDSGAVEPGEYFSEDEILWAWVTCSRCEKTFIWGEELDELIYDCDDADDFLRRTSFTCCPPPPRG